MTTSQQSRLGQSPEESIKEPVVASTTENITLSGEQTLNTVPNPSPVKAGDRVLVRSQTNLTENGIYIVSTTAWTRANDFNDVNDVLNGQGVTDSNEANPNFLAIYFVRFAGSDYHAGTTQVSFVNPLTPGYGDANLQLYVDNKSGKVFDTFHLDSLYDNGSKTVKAFNQNAKYLVTKSYYDSEFYHDKQAKGGRLYKIQPLGTDTVDGGHIIDYGPVQLKMIEAKLIPANPWHFGALGNGADDINALQALNDFHMNANATDVVSYTGEWSITTGLLIGKPVTSTASVRIRDKSIVGGGMVLTAITGNLMDYMMKVEGTDRLTIEGVVRLVGGAVTGGSRLTVWADRSCIDGLIFGTNTEFRMGGIHTDAFKNYGVAIGNTVTPHISNNNPKLGVVRGFRCGSGAGIHLPTPVASQALQANYSNVVSTTTANSFGQKTVMNVTELPPEFVEGYHQTQVNVHIGDDVYQVESIDRAGGKITIYPFLNPATATTGSLYYQFGGAVGMSGNDSNLMDIDTIATNTCATALWVASLYGANVRQIISQFDCSALVIGKNKQSAHIGGNYNVYVEGEKHWLIRRTVTGDNVVINPIVIDNFKNASQCHIPRGSFGSEGFYGAYGIYDMWNINYNGKRLENDKRMPALQEISQSYNVDLTSPSPYLYRANSATGIKLLRGLDTVNSGNFSQQITFIGRTTSGPSNGRPTGTFTFEADVGDTIVGAGTVTGNKIAYDGFRGPVTFNIQYNQATKVWYVYPDMSWNGYP